MKLVKLKHRRLAEGEATGHFHAISGGTLYAEEGTKVPVVAVIKDDVEVTHQEHGPFILPRENGGPKPGEYDIGGVQEYDPFDQIAKRVVD